MGICPNRVIKPNLSITRFACFVFPFPGYFCPCRFFVLVAVPPIAYVLAIDDFKLFTGLIGIMDDIKTDYSIVVRIKSGCMQDMEVVEGAVERNAVNSVWLLLDLRTTELNEEITNVKKYAVENVRSGW